MFTPPPNIPCRQRWLRLPAPSSGGSAPAQLNPEEAPAKLIWSHQQLLAYLTRTALRGKVPLPAISNPSHCGKQIESWKVVCAEQDYKENREARVGHGRKKG